MIAEREVGIIAITVIVLVLVLAKWIKGNGE